MIFCHVAELLPRLLKNPEICPCSDAPDVFQFAPQ
jgi:hypothetical protein